MIEGLRADHSNARDQSESERQAVCLAPRNSLRQQLQDPPVQLLIAAIARGVHHANPLAGHLVHQALHIRTRRQVVDDNGALAPQLGRGGQAVEGEGFLVGVEGALELDHGVAVAEELGRGDGARVEDDVGDVVVVGAGVVAQTLVVVVDGLGVGGGDVVEEDAMDGDVAVLVGGPVGVGVDVLVHQSNVAFRVGGVDVAERADVADGVEGFDAFDEVGVWVVIGTGAGVGVYNHVIQNAWIGLDRVHERFPRHIVFARVYVEGDQ